MKFAFSSNAFRNYSLIDAISSISAAGFSGIEIMCDSPHAFPQDLSEDDIDSIRTQITEKGLKISNLNAFMMCAVEDFHHPSWIEKDEKYRDVRVQYTLECIKMAHQMNVRTISTEPGGPVCGMTRDEAIDIFIEGLKQVIPEAVKRGVQVLIEPEPGLLIQTANEFVDFMDKFGEKGLGLNFDVGHFFCVGEDPVEKIMQLREYISHFHLEDIPETREHKHIMLGQGGIDIPKVLETIEKIGYQGFVTVELYPYLEQAHDIARMSMKYVTDECGYE